jgi:hypothetical protein
MKKGAFIRCCIVSAVLLLLSGCSQMVSYQQGIYDNLDKIAARGDIYTYIGKRMSYAQGHLTLSFKEFTGKQTIWKLVAEQDCAIELRYNMQLDDGLFKSCLILAGGEVIVLADGTRNEDMTLNLKKGYNYLVIVGNAAKGQVDMTIVGNDQVKVTLEEE